MTTDLYSPLGPQCHRWRPACPSSRWEPAGSSLQSRSRMFQLRRKLTINVPLILKVREMIFFRRQKHIMGHFEWFFEGISTYAQDNFGVKKVSAPSKNLSKWPIIWTSLPLPHTHTPCHHLQSMSMWMLGEYSGGWELQGDSVRTHTVLWIRIRIRIRKFLPVRIRNNHSESGSGRIRNKMEWKMSSKTQYKIKYLISLQ